MPATVAILTSRTRTLFAFFSVSSFFSSFSNLLSSSTLFFHRFCQYWWAVLLVFLLLFSRIICKLLRRYMAVALLLLLFLFRFILHFAFRMFAIVVWANASSASILLVIFNIVLRTMSQISNIDLPQFWEIFGLV